MYLTTTEILAIHEAVIDAFGGTHGLRDKGALEAAVFRPQTGYYDDVIHEAAALMESLAMNHPFLDGNKRVAFFATDTFLRMNGLRIDVAHDEAHPFLMHLFDTGTFDVAHLRQWLQGCVVS